MMTTDRVMMDALRTLTRDGTGARLHDVAKLAWGTDSPDGRYARTLLDYYVDQGFAERERDGGGLLRYRITHLGACQLDATEVRP